ncbi:MAG: (2Fe-2S)-binding protein [Puniceicoccales bacterium]|nr:(2Fe-2S)-binding protein [Puniceicoccales bacterium]
MPAAVPSRPSAPLVRIHVDGVECEVPAGTNLVEAARKVGVEIPHFCYHSQLSVAGNCRMCLVETGVRKSDPSTGDAGTGPGGAPEIAWSPKPASACTTLASEGLHVRTLSPLVRECREGVLEFLNLNHPLDCPVCDQAGECRLQEYAFAHGRGYSRAGTVKNRKPKALALGPRVMFDAERCILCGRCVRFFREISKNPVLGFVKRGSRSELACFPGTELDDNYSVNAADLCPVGALTSTSFRFGCRVWFLQKTPSICPESSAGVNTDVWHRDGRVFRITPRRNDAVNDSWMPDSGREFFRMQKAPDRMCEHLRDGVAVTSAAAIAAAGALLRASSGRVAYVASGRLALEAQYLAALLVRALPGPVWLPAHPGPADGLLVSEERTPNFRGALLSGLFDRPPDADLAPLAAALGSGAVQTLVIFCEDVTAFGVSPELLRKNRLKIIYFTPRADETTARASVVFPVLHVFEKDGTFVNRQFRLQKFLRAVPGPEGVPAEMATLVRLLHALADGEGLAANGGSAAALPEPNVSAVWRQLGASPGPLHGLTFEGIPPEGVLLDGSPWAHIGFPEKSAALHYNA